MIDKTRVRALRQKLAVLRVAWRTNPLRAIDILIEKINRLLMPDAIWNYNEINVHESSGKVLVVYKEPLYFGGFSLPTPFPTKRQSQWQSAKIIEFFDGKGYQVDVVAHDEDVDIEDLSVYDIIFGVNPNFYQFANAAPKRTTKIEFATAMHWSERNEAIRRDYRRFNKKHATNLSPRRIVGEYPSTQIADGVVVIGDERTRRSYLRQVDGTPVVNVEASTYDFLSCRIESKDFSAARTNFLWMSGSGLVFKGLDVVLDAFSGLEKCELYVCAPLEADVEFAEMYDRELHETDNIHVEGWVDLRSDRFEELIDTCGYLIAPSVTEGSPGSVLHTGRCGVVPILTPQVFDDVDEWGIELPARDVATIKETIQRASVVDPEYLERMALNACTRVKQENNRDRFTSRINDALETVIEVQADT